jgi:hypothetical protein
MIQSIMDNGKKLTTQKELFVFMNEFYANLYKVNYVWMRRCW